MAVHPHMRGEYMSPVWHALKPSGSSPHAWGIRAVMPSLAQPMRFIPTCVGNTRYRPGSARHDPVHPHMRGEYLCAPLWRAWCAGSSPHAWGIRLVHAPGLRLSRFIPTCVGNTIIPSDPPRPGSVHPHMRGEYQTGQDLTSSPTGSSPHAWGIRAWPGSRSRGCRFIPTCVGNTSRPALHKIGKTVHPHMRGEYR